MTTSWPDETPLAPGFDDPDTLLRHIASMADCRRCYPEGYSKPNGAGGTIINERTGYCSGHRDPILHALGYVYGWTMRGGMPQKMGER